MATISRVRGSTIRNLITDDDIVEAFVLRDDLDDILGQHFDMHAAWYRRADRDIEVHVAAKPRRVTLADDRLDSRALILRELDRSAAWSRCLIGILFIGIHA